MCKLCWGITGLLAIILLVGGYKIVIEGNTQLTTDGRRAVLVEVNERDLILTEMRGLLTSVQQITQGISAKDMKMVASAARQSGGAAVHEIPASVVAKLFAKLPIEFKTLGLDTHDKFDQLALDAEQFNDPTHSLQQLSTLMGNCIACHQAYRIDLINHSEKKK